MKTTFNYFETLYYAFFSDACYRDIAKCWTGVAAFYLFLVMAICWLPIAWQESQVIKETLQARIAPMMDNLPILTLNKGKISIKEQQPYYLRDKNNVTLGIIDTTGKITSLEKEDANLLMTQDKVYVRMKDEKISTYDVSKLPDMVIDKERATLLTQRYIAYVFVWLYPAFTLTAFLYQLLQSLIFGLFAMMFAFFMKYQLRYSAAVRLSVVSVTPMLFVTTLFKINHIQFMAQGFVYFLIEVFYLLFAVRSNKPSLTDAS